MDEGWWDTDTSFEGGPSVSAEVEWSFTLIDARWWELFRYDQYDWEDPDFRRQNVGPYAYRPVRTTQGYFFMVSPQAYDRMTKFPDGRGKRWSIKVDRDESGEIIRMYAKRHGRKGFDDVEFVYAHREVLGVSDLACVVDHVNRWGLDCRGDVDRRHFGNLRPVGYDENMVNGVRPKKSGLPVGVVQSGCNKEGKPLYIGQYCIRISKTKVKTTRSRRKWLSPEHAAQWYQNQMKRRYRRTHWATCPITVNYPLFPPRTDQNWAREEEIPF